MKISTITKQACLMYYLDEAAVTACVDTEALMPHLEAMFVRMSQGTGVNFPVVREPLMHESATFGIKSGFDASGPMLGIKTGGYWPKNVSRGEANHQSCVLLLDANGGGPRALVRGNRLTALRTAASSAVSVKYLSRESSRVLGVLGAGAQSRAQVEAVLTQRPFAEVLVVDPDQERCRRLAKALPTQSVAIRCCEAEEMARCSDVIITLTPSTRAIIHPGWIRAGTHLCCVGADTQGKQEVDERLFPAARVFCDDRAQAITIGECQHAVAGNLLAESAITEIGDVISGAREGRSGEQEITIYDSTGVGLQDVVAASVALEAALDRGLAKEIG